MTDDAGKMKKGNFVDALESIRLESQKLLKRSDLPPDVKAGLERIAGYARGKFDLGGDTE
jgi:hypothetical protein